MTIATPKPSGNAANGPRWASVSPGTVRLDPTSGQKDTGWLSGQRPPYNVANWLHGVAYDWQQYLEDATDELDSSKLNRDGTGTAGELSGTILPDATGTIDLGRTNAPGPIRAFRRIIGDLIVAGHGLWAGDPFTKGLVVGDASSGQFQMGGGARVSGNFHPLATGTQALGTSALRWDAFFDDLDVDDVTINTTLTMGASARLSSDMLPSANNTRDLGSSALRWSDVFTTNLNTNTATVNTSILPDTAGGASNGSNALPWTDVVTRTIRTKTIAVYDNNDVPGSVAELYNLTSLGTIVGLGTQTSNTTAPSTSSHKYNINNFARTGVGVYTVTMTVAPGLYVAFAQGTTNGVWCSVQPVGATCTVRCFTTAGAPVDSTFAFIAFGQPQSVWTDPIS